MSARFTPEAEEDLGALVAYLVERNPTAAAGLAERIFEVVTQLAEGHFDGPEQTLRTGEAVRSWPVPPVRIYYQRTAGELWVLRVYHQARFPLGG
jgi:plasmid stabilization system protein ParE